MYANPVQIDVNEFDIQSYRKYKKLKDLSTYKVKGNSIITEKNSLNALYFNTNKSEFEVNDSFAYDYQLYTVNRALYQKRFGNFKDCGLGKMLELLLFSREVAKKGKVLFLCPLQTLQETINDRDKFNIDIDINNLRETNTTKAGINILNYESLKDIDLSGFSGIVLDEGSILKNASGRTSKWLRDLASNIEYLMDASATPAPNNHAEYAPHAVWLGYSKSVSEFYSRFFRQQGNKWQLKDWAVDDFYQFLSSFMIYIQNPTKLGFKKGGFLTEKPQYEYLRSRIDNSERYIGQSLFPTKLSFQQKNLIYNELRSNQNTERFEQSLNKAKEYKSIIWCSRNNEERAFYNALKNDGYHLITGTTKVEKRVELYDAFRDGQINGLISKPKVSGWGINLQQAEAHIFSGYNDSFEAIYQAVRRSHRNGRKGRLKVFFPVTNVETSIIDSTMLKLKNFESDVERVQSKFKIDYKSIF